jgi:hypothetical protein
MAVAGIRSERRKQLGYTYYGECMADSGSLKSARGASGVGREAVPKLGESSLDGG